MSKKPDKKYFLSGFDIKQPPMQFNLLKSQIDEVGFFEAGTKTERVKIYSPGVAYILSSNKLFVKDLTTKETKYIDGTSYLNGFMEAYKEGQEYFDERDSKKVAKNLAIQYENDTNTRAWSYAKESNPLLISRKVLKEYGYYSGILSKLDEFVNENPDLFFEEKAEVNSDSSGNNRNDIEKIKVKIKEYGFLTLPKVKVLKDDSYEYLVRLIVNSQWPYRIAMFDYLNFLAHLRKEYFKNNDERNEKLAEWFGSGNPDDIRKNISSLTKKPSSNRYTAYQHKEKVREQYLELKNGVPRP